MELIISWIMGRAKALYYLALTMFVPSFYIYNQLTHLHFWHNIYFPTLIINIILEQIYPEYEKIFNDKYGSSSLAILKKYLLSENIAQATIDELQDILKVNSHNRFSVGKACELKESAINTFGIKLVQSAFAFQLKQLIERLELLNDQII